MIFLRSVIAGILVFVPVLSFAQSKDFAWLAYTFTDIISLIIPVIFGLTLVVFLWGITKAWVLHGGDENEVTKGKNIALSSVIALVVMSGIWGIVALLRSSIFGV